MEQPCTQLHLWAFARRPAGPKPCSRGTGRARVGGSLAGAPCRARGGKTAISKTNDAPERRDCLLRGSRADPPQGSRLLPAQRAGEGATGSPWCVQVQPLQPLQPLLFTPRLHGWKGCRCFIAVTTGLGKFAPLAGSHSGYRGASLSGSVAFSFSCRERQPFPRVRGETACFSQLSLSGF